MGNLVIEFIRDEEGQDLIEYSLLIAFVVLASALIFKAAGQGVQGVWTAANSRLATANIVAAS